MPRTPTEKLIPRGDTLLVRSFPKVARHLNPKQIAANRSEMEAYLKLLPGAIERLQAVTTQTNDLHESVEVAIAELRTSFGSRNASAVESITPDGTSNAPLELEETADSVSEPELPNGSDTDQTAGDNALSRNELGAASGSGGESDSPQERPQNARVRTKQKLSGRALAKRRVWASGESADDQGRLSESEGGSKANGS